MNVQERTEQVAGRKAFVNESRRCHFSLGDDKVEYKSDTRRAMELTAKSGPGIAARADARTLKQQLQRTALVIGDDV